MRLHSETGTQAEQVRLVTAGELAREGLGALERALADLSAICTRPDSGPAPAG